MGKTHRHIWSAWKTGALIVLTLLVFHGSAKAGPDWLEVGENPDRSWVYLDRSSLRIESRKPHVVLRMLTMTDKPSGSVDRVLSYIVERRIDCRTKSVRNLQTWLHYKHMAQGKGVSVPQKSPKIATPPYSVIGRLIRDVCEAARRHSG